MTIATAAPGPSHNRLSSLPRRHRRPSIAAIKRAAAARLEADRLVKAFELNIEFVLSPK